MTSPTQAGDWQELAVKRVADVSYGLGQPPKLNEEGIPIIRATNIERGSIIPDNLIFADLDDLPLDRAPLLQADEILVVRSGVYTGDSARVTHAWAGSAPGYDLRLTPRLVDSRFLAYALRGKHISEQIDLAKNRAAQPHINAEDLGSSRLRIPSRQLQHRIADYLDDETRHIDWLVSKRLGMIALLEERAQAILSKVCFGPIIYRADGRPAGIEGMRCVRLGALSLIQSGLTLDGKRDSGADPMTLPYLRVANVQDGWLDLDRLKEVTVPRTLADRCSLRAGDVLMTEGGDPDKLGRGTVWSGEVKRCLHQNHVFAVRPNGSLLPEYLALVTRTPYARAYFEMTASKTTGIASTSVTKIAGFCIPLPSIAEQTRIVQSIGKRLRKLDALLSRLTRQVTLLLERRQALITAAVMGDVEVPGAAA